MKTFYISEVNDDFYSECLGLEIEKMTPALVYVRVPLLGTATIEIEIPIEAVEIGVINDDE